MTSFKQIEANRRNALKSTGPTSQQGKHRSRRNALRHGLTAETVIGGLEDTEDYSGFEKAIAAEYDAESPVERELVLRLASLLWRLRRALMMESGLFAIQAEHLQQLNAMREDSDRCATPQPRLDCVRSITQEQNASAPVVSTEHAFGGRRLAHCFLRLANLPSYPLDRLSRYEATLWRQTVKTLVALDVLDRKARRRSFPSSRRLYGAAE
jgi:hypothetical protein